MIKTPANPCAHESACVCRLPGSNALAMINGDAEYATFIDHVNAMIERQKAISKARVTRAKNADEKPGEL